MSTRRKFIRNTGLASLVLATGLPTFGNATIPPFVSRRPSLNKRRFTSQAVEETIINIKKNMGDEELAWMFENCFPNTLDTTVTYSENNG